MYFFAGKHNWKIVQASVLLKVIVKDFFLYCISKYKREVYLTYECNW